MENQEKLSRKTTKFEHHLITETARLGTNFCSKFKFENIYAKQIEKKKSRHLPLLTSTIVPRVTSAPITHCLCICGKFPIFCLNSLKIRRIYNNYSRHCKN